MILIAENLNSSIPSVQKAMADRHEAWLGNLVERLDKSPAAYLDVNAGCFHEQEPRMLDWLVRLVRRISAKPLVLDSPDPAVLAEVCQNLLQEGLLAGPDQTGSNLPSLLLNSITLEPRRFTRVAELARSTGAGLIALLMGPDGYPRSLEERLTHAAMLLERLNEAGIAEDRVFLDPMVRPVATDDQAGLEALEAVRKLRDHYPGVHIVIGISNISYGLPARRHLNRAFLLQAMAMGLDCAILDTLDADLMALQQAASTLLGQDACCMNYLGAHRPG